MRQVDLLGGSPGVVTYIPRPTVGWGQSSRIDRRACQRRCVIRQAKLEVRKRRSHHESAADHQALKDEAVRHGMLVNLGTC